jgi:hypothetical protein
VSDEKAEERSGAAMQHEVGGEGRPEGGGLQWRELELRQPLPLHDGEGWRDMRRQTKCNCKRLL